MTTKETDSGCVSQFESSVLVSNQTEQYPTVNKSHDPRCKDPVLDMDTGVNQMFNGGINTQASHSIQGNVSSGSQLDDSVME